MNKLLYIILITITVLNVSKIKVNEKRLEVAKVICAEMCSEGEYAMQGVANTIHNRMIKYNKSAYEIVTAKNQYYGYTNKNKNTIFQDKHCKEYSINLSKKITKLNDITNGALYFRVDGEKIQSWHKELTIKIGRVSFYK